MLTASNSLSFIRAPLAFLFLQENPTLRLIAIILAMVTDSFDGYLARKSQSVTKFGAILDPTMDKFFVYFAMTVLFLEQKIAPWEMAAMLSRDFFVCLYGLFMILAGRWKTVVFRAIRWGKITTALQFIVLIGLVVDITFPWYVFSSFMLMGWLAFLELFQARTSTA
ncbi:MAG: CDP-diacylglycerol--glycerol-3-phosphate 3-phosphatidyltransferase [Chlamydiae bacterium CG10_big_fil_rev_8_21_14_0_10_42_34]|nr:MAG: CDP-diacylglycerol--glycerol-3-phosphate 3-phosphatidyltransferase [Chlamydiae bacterium CG10_big_fil_rev_8_21_14_0_10_42_34]